MTDSSMLPFDETLRPSVVFLRCPIRASLDVLGRKWTFLILYSMAFLKAHRFVEIRRYIPELTPRTLSKRLQQLEQAGFIEKVEERRSPRTVRWVLTEMGRDTIPILIRRIQHSSKWQAGRLFADKVPRALREIFPVTMQRYAD